MKTRESDLVVFDLERGIDGAGVLFDERVETGFLLGMAVVGGGDEGTEDGA